ncbi:MAG: nuclear transport factor 2 family protein [Burkholderiales bacterium]
MDTPIDLGALFRAIDARDADAFAAFLAPDGAFRYGSAPVVRGRAAARAAVAAFFDSIAGLGHRIVARWDTAEGVVCEGEVTYTLADARRVTLPFVNVLRLSGRLVDDYRIYIDPSPLVTPPD